MDCPHEHRSPNVSHRWLTPKCSSCCLNCVLRGQLKGSDPSCWQDFQPMTFQVGVAERPFNIGNLKLPVWITGPFPLNTMTVSFVFL